MARLPTCLAATLALSACSQADLPGHYFDVVLTGDGDECNEPDIADKEEWTYRLVLDGAAVQIFIGEDLMATGSIAGCDLVYRSPIWTDNRGPRENVRWSIGGTAQVSLNDLCDAGDGWVGTERIDVVSSSDPEVPPGCSYSFDVAGTYAGEVE